MQDREYIIADNKEGLQVRIYKKNEAFLSYIQEFKRENPDKEVLVPSSSSIHTIYHSFFRHQDTYSLIAVLKDKERTDAGRYRLLLIK